MVFVTSMQFSVAQDYPFDNLPNNITATLDVDTDEQEEFKNTLLGYNIEGFNTAAQKNFIKKFDPITIRFPHGVWANFYKWQTDGYQQDSYDNGSHQTVLNTYVSSIKGHIGGIQQLNTERKAANNGKGYDMMWTYSINFDNGASSVARAQNDLSRGLDVKDIELGNEHFWKNQRSNRTKLPEDYLREAKAVSAALKNEFPNIRVSIPLGWRRNQAGYNATIAGNKDYYDAITIHKYIGADPDKPGESDKAYSTLLSARLTLADDVNWVRDNYGPGKPVWLTEWGVSGGSNVHAGACLGMFDTYLYMSENQHIYDRANWFSFNRVLNAMVVVGGNREPVYPLKKRGYLWTYEILHDVLKDATMFDSQMNTFQITTDKGVLNAVSARAVTKNGETTVLAVNLTDKPATFVLKFDGNNYTKSFKHEALVFDDLGEVDPVLVDQNMLDLIKNGSGSITLPPLSISKISNIDISIDLDVPVVTITAPADGAKLIVGETVPFNADVTDVNGMIEKVNFKINDAFNKSDLAAPYTHTFTPDSAGTYKLAVRGFDNDNNQIEEFITVTAVVKEPYGGIPIVIPGTVEAEDYDLGGQDISYNDATPVNQSGVYRLDEGVDVGEGNGGFILGYTAGGEWLDYTVDVAESGLYTFEFHISSKNGGGEFGLSIDGDDLTGIVSVPQTGEWSIYQEFSEDVDLEEGEHVLRLNVLKSGFNLDKMVVTKAMVTGSSVTLGDHDLAIYPNPSTGQFHLSRSGKWEVYHVEGELLLKGTGELMDLSNQSKGMYFVKTQGAVLKVMVN